MTEQISCSTLRPTLRMLSDEQIGAIHRTSLDILGATGILMKQEGARSLLLGAGAWEAEGRIKIPEYLVEQALRSAPSRIPMYNRLGRLTMPLEEGKVFFGTGSDCPFTIDVETHERRTAVAEDVRRFARLCDGLEQIDFVMSMGTPSDVPTMDHYVHSFIEMIRGTVKPNVYTASCRARHGGHLRDRLRRGRRRNAGAREAVHAVVRRADLAVALQPGIRRQSSILRREGGSQ